MRTTFIVVAAAVLSAAALAGCGGDPRTGKPKDDGSIGEGPKGEGPKGDGPKGEGGPSKVGGYEPKERFSLDTGIKNDDGKPTGTTAVAVSPDGKLALVMASTKAGNVQVWDLEGRKKLHQFNNPIGSMLPVAISPDGKWGAYPTQSNSPSIVLIDLASGKVLRRLRKKDDAPLDVFTMALTFSHKGDLLVAGSGKEIIGWDPSTGTERFVWQETANVESLSGFFEDGKKIASGTDKGSVKVWGVAEGKPLKTLVESGEKISHLFVTPDGKRLGVKSSGPMKMWDLAAGTETNSVNMSPGMWSSVCALPDNRTVVYNGDAALVLVDTVTGDERRFSEDKTFEARRYPVALTPDGTTLVSGEDSGKLRVWDLKRR